MTACRHTSPCRFERSERSLESRFNVRWLFYHLRSAQCGQPGRRDRLLFRHRPLRLYLSPDPDLPTRTNQWSVVMEVKFDSISPFAGFLQLDPANGWRAQRHRPKLMWRQHHQLGNRRQ